MAPSQGASAKLSIASVHGGIPPAVGGGALVVPGLPMGETVGAAGDGVAVPHATAVSAMTQASALKPDRRWIRGPSIATSEVPAGDATDGRGAGRRWDDGRPRHVPVRLAPVDPAPLSLRAATVLTPTLGPLVTDHGGACWPT